MSLLYAGLDVSLETTSICVIDAEGRIKLEAKAPSDPEAISDHLSQLTVTFERVGLEAVPCRNGSISVCVTAAIRSSASRRGIPRLRSRR